MLDEALVEKYVLLEKRYSGNHLNLAIEEVVRMREIREELLAYFKEKRSHLRHTVRYEYSGTSEVNAVCSCGWRSHTAEMVNGETPFFLLFRAIRDHGEDN